MRLTKDVLIGARRRLLQMHFESGVGHIGGNLSALDALMVLFHEYVSPDDKLILSKGHAAGALYITLWTLGRLSSDLLKQFHGDDTLLAGHPPVAGIPDIPFATGSLGHGLSLAAGTALAFALQRRRGHVFCITSDGEWQEGSTWEALIFMCHHRLANLTVLVDHNKLQGFGSTEEVASMAPLWEKLRGFDVTIATVSGHDIEALRKTLDRTTSRPRIIFLETIKGHGVRFMENRVESHYLPLKEADYLQAIKELETK
jgi:transketolase